MDNYIKDFIQKAIFWNRKSSKDTDCHLITLFGLILNLRAKRILELGVRDGNTTLPLLCGAFYTNGKVESIDLNQTSFQCPNELKPYWTFYQKDAIAYLESIPEEVIYDIIFVDDWHSYGHVTKELKLLSSHVNKSSLILLHDTMHSFAHPDYNSNTIISTGQFANGGVYKAVCDLDKRLWEFSTIPTCHGLTILRKKK